MLSHSGESVTFDAWYSANKQGVLGLTVLVDVYDPSGTRIVSAAPTGEPGGGFYTYTLAGVALTLAGNYRALFRTADPSVDSQDIPALWIARQPWVERIDVTVGSRAIAGTVTQTAPYGAAGLIRLHVGSDYGPSPGNLPRVLWTVGPGAAPDASGGAFAVHIPGLAGSPFAGSIVIASPSDVQLFEGLFSHAQTTAWVTGTHHFRAWLVTAGGAQVLIAEGLIEVGPGA